MALKVYTFIAEHCNHLNALVCPVDVMAEEFGVHERTIRRALRWLEDERHLVIVKIGTANAYILDPADIWKNYERYKGYCAFHANTLASKRQNKLLKTRLTHMLEGSEEAAPPDAAPDGGTNGSKGAPRRPRPTRKAKASTGQD